MQNELDSDKVVYISAGLLKWENGRIVEKTAEEYELDQTPISMKGKEC